MKVDFGMELAPVCRGDLEMLRAWRNDHLVWRYCRQNDLISDIEQEAWFQRQAADPTIKMYVVKRRVEGQRVPVGVCGLTSIDMLNRRAEFSLYVGPEHHRKGYGKEAMKLLMAHAFQNLGMLQIWGESFDGNPAMTMFDDLGFKRDGVRRQFYFREGRLVDAHLYSILREEWISSLQASASLSPSASSPTPPAPEPGSPEGGAIWPGEAADVTLLHRGRPPPREECGPSLSATSEHG